MLQLYFNSLEESMDMNGGTGYTGIDEYLSKKIKKEVSHQMHCHRGFQICISIQN